MMFLIVFTVPALLFCYRPLSSCYTLFVAEVVFAVLLLCHIALKTMWENS